MDIRADYPANKGFSVRNLKYMAKFAATYSEQEFVQQAVAQIPWGHNIVLLDKITDSEQRRWYAETCQKNGWSRNVLIHQIESGLYERQVLNSKVSNFKQRLPSPQSELSTQTMKDPYVFDFIPFREDTDNCDRKLSPHPTIFHLKFYLLLTKTAPPSLTVPLII